MDKLRDLESEWNKMTYMPAKFAEYANIEGTKRKDSELTKFT